MKASTPRRVPTRWPAFAAPLLALGIVGGCASPDEPAYKPVVPHLAGSKTIVLEPVRMPRWSTNSRFVDYDTAMVQQIEKRWHDLIEESGRSISANNHGSVVVEFQLNSDGRVTDMRAAESDLDQRQVLLCMKAVLDGSPYLKWPVGAVEALGATRRPIKFTFHYRK